MFLFLLILKRITLIVITITIIERSKYFPYLLEWVSQIYFHIKQCSIFVEITISCSHLSCQVSSKLFRQFIAGTCVKLSMLRNSMWEQLEFFHSFDLLLQQQRHFSCIDYLHYIQYGETVDTLSELIFAIWTSFIPFSSPTFALFNNQLRTVHQL